MISEIVTVGTELMMGKTMDSHSAYLSRECTLLGIEVIYHTSMADDRDRLLQIFSLGSMRSNLMFICGGLGPTIDDITKETLAEFLKVELKQNQQVVLDLHHLFEYSSESMSLNNLKQTYVFPEGRVFHNANGTAPGLAITKNGVTYVLLPGPPQELMPMFTAEVSPFLKKMLQDRPAIITQELSFGGIGESSLEERLYDFIQDQSKVNIASYVNETGVTLRLTAKTKNHTEAQARIADVKAKILKRVGEYCFSDKGETLEEIVISLLQKYQQTIAMVESCTGGLLTHLLSSIPGSSQVLNGGWICYTNEIKQHVLKIPVRILEKYGSISQQTAAALAEQTIKVFQSDFALSITGVAGPDPCEGKSVGQVFIGLAEKEASTVVNSLVLKGSRQQIQMLAAKHALIIIQQRLRKGERIR